jgi:hypothetical protein
MFDGVIKATVTTGRALAWTGVAAWTAAKAVMFLLSLAVIVPCVAIIIWFALWIGTAFFDAQLSYAIGGWGKDIYESFGWIRICSILLVVLATGWLFRGIPLAALRPETEEEKRQRLINVALVAERSRKEDQARWERSMGYR